jgi:pimeloyl-ACP methyl ester carboxylesterase
MKQTAQILAVLLVVAIATGLPSSTPAANQPVIPSGCNGAVLAGRGTPAPDDKVTPVIFVHGIMSSEAMWDDPIPGSRRGSLLASVAAIPGVATYTFDYRQQSLDWVTKDSVGPRLGRAITCLATQAKRKVVVVAHSMGGLATRLAAAQSDGVGGRVADHLATVITLGTPYQGSLLLTLLASGIDALATSNSPYALAVRAIRAWCGLRAQALPEGGGDCGLLGVPATPAGRALRVGSPQLAALPPWPPRLPVHAIAGDLRLWVSLLGHNLTAPIPLGDIAVTVGSALAGATAPSRTVDPCFKVAIGQAFASPCFHDHLHTDGILAGTVIRLIRETVMAPHPRATGIGSPLGRPVGPAVPLPRTAWSPVGDTEIRPGSRPDSFRVAFAGTFWGGARHDVAPGCDYVLSGSARILHGDGYGFAVRANLDAGDPIGQAIQYDPGLGGYRDTVYPDSEGGKVTSSKTDSDWHRITIAVLGGRYAASIDGKVVGQGRTALRCGGLFLRVWRTTAEFRGMTMTRLQ